MYEFTDGIGTTKDDSFLFRIFSQCKHDHYNSIILQNTINRRRNQTSLQECKRWVRHDSQSIINRFLRLFSPWEMPLTFLWGMSPTWQFAQPLLKSRYLRFQYDWKEVRYAHWFLRFLHDLFISDGGPLWGTCLDLPYFGLCEKKDSLILPSQAEYLCDDFSIYVVLINS